MVGLRFVAPLVVAAAFASPLPDRACSPTRPGWMCDNTSKKKVCWQSARCAAREAPTGLCARGLLASYTDAIGVCCARACGTCGGAGCAARGALCCHGAVLAGGARCRRPDDVSCVARRDARRRTADRRSPGRGAACAGGTPCMPPFATCPAAAAEAPPPETRFYAPPPADARPRVPWLEDALRDAELAAPPCRRVAASCALRDACSRECAAALVASDGLCPESRSAAHATRLCGAPKARAPLVVLVHLQKTGGWSVVDLFRRAGFGCPWDDGCDLKADASDETGLVSADAGARRRALGRVSAFLRVVHVELPLGGLVVDADTHAYVTVLREPLARARSDYRMTVRAVRAAGLCVAPFENDANATFAAFVAPASVPPRPKKKRERRRR